MSNTRELSQLASLINIIDQSKSIGVVTEYPNAKIGIGTLAPTSKVDVIGDVNVSGAITATSFYGDLTGNADTATYATTAGIATYTSNAGVATYASVAGIATYATTAGIATSTVGGYVDVVNASISGISTLGFFSDEQTLSQDLSLADNTRYYSVHKNLTIDDGSTLTIGSGSTILLDRFNNLDDVKAQSLSVTGIITATSFYGDGSNLNGISVNRFLSIIPRVGSAVTVNLYVGILTVFGRNENTNVLI